MTITKYFDSIKKAETYQNSLYNRYHSVKLIGFPCWGGEAGHYTWKVS